MKKKTRTLPSKMNPMTPNRLITMKVIDTYEFFKLLFEPSTGCYFVYNNYTTASHYSRSFNTASSLFDRAIGLLD